MYKEFLLITNKVTLWYDTEERLLINRKKYQFDGHIIEFCGKIKVEMVYSNDDRDKLVIV